MRVWVLVGVLCLSGCGTLTTLEELEQQAMLTGDWSAVEEREKILARRDARRGLQCPSGLVAFCESRMGEHRCTCIDNDAVRDLFAGRY